ncbi:MAG: hypothetical protein M1820_006686 [Bogoriella megaspora]|nr:MAG: hypothetical protein M1820_006686 [Bogoriella megaspora]
MAQFDANMWYQLTEARVGFGSALTSWGGNTTGFQAYNESDLNQYWQIIPFADDTNAYAFRSRTGGVGLAIGTCYRPDEIDPSHTQPCHQVLDTNDDNQRWTFGAWSNNTNYIVNVGNGSGYHLDVHPGNPVFMSSETSAEANDPGQHWMIQPIEAINDGGWGTALSPGQTFSATPLSVSQGSSGATATDSAASTVNPTGAAATTSVPASSASTSAPAPSRISPGAAAGIGVGVTVAVLLLLSTAILLFLRRRAQKRQEQQYPHLTGNRNSTLAAVRHDHSPKYWTHPQEVDTDGARIEAPDTAFQRVELPTESYNKEGTDDKPPQVPPKG